MSQNLRRDEPKLESGKHELSRHLAPESSTLTHTCICFFYLVWRYTNRKVYESGKMRMETVVTFEFSLACTDSHDF